MKVKRLDCNPIIHLSMSPSLGGNVNGPSLIQSAVMASGPARQVLPLFRAPCRIVHQAGILRPSGRPLEHLRAWNAAHRAVPLLQPCRVTGRPRGRREARDFACTTTAVVPDRVQRSKVAVSTDGLNFQASPESLGEPYFRVFQWTGYHYALGMPGVFYRSEDGTDQLRAGAYVVPGQHAAHRPGCRRERRSEGLLHQRVRLTGADPPLNHRPQRGLVQVESLGASSGTRA